MNFKAFFFFVLLIVTKILRKSHTKHKRSNVIRDLSHSNNKKECWKHFPARWEDLDEAKASLDSHCCKQHILPTKPIMGQKQKINIKCQLNSIKMKLIKGQLIHALLICHWRDTGRPLLSHETHWITLSQ